MVRTIGAPVAAPRKGTGMLHPHPNIAAKLKEEAEHCLGRPLPGGPLWVVLLASPGDTAKFRVALTAFLPG